RDRMYGEALSTALAVHLLRKYGSVSTGPQRAHGGLSREKLTRVLEYIHERLQSDLIVADMAQAIHMSPYHFSRLFKVSTGRSPSRYVIEARAKKARDLLASGKVSIAEAAQQAGFVDQSHLTRNFKQIFGTTPKTFHKLAR